MKILVTGAAGFIGAKLMLMLAQKGNIVIGIDNINDYYDVRLKYSRLKSYGITPINSNFKLGEKFKVLYILIAISYLHQ